MRKIYLLAVSSALVLSSCTSTVRTYITPHPTSARYVVDGTIASGDTIIVGERCVVVVVVDSATVYVQMRRWNGAGKALVGPDEEELDSTVLHQHETGVVCP